MNEASMHSSNCFVTLTYDEAHHEPSLNYRHIQKFLRELRREKPVRFFIAGEYGESTWRPHWHGLLFGVHFNAQVPIGANLSRSPELEKYWPWGYSSIGELNQQTAAYVASYCIKKATGPLAEERYTRYNTDTGEIHKITPEFARMSLKPGIGATYYAKYHREIHYARDGIVRQGGKTTKPPRYYDKLLQIKDMKQYTELETNRQLDALTRSKDNTTQRLQTREIVAIAKQSQKRKKL